MTSLKVSALANELAASLTDVDGVLEVYVFGSALRTSRPADVDLVVVYGLPLTPATAPAVREGVELAVARIFELPAHLMFFTEAEAKQPGLLSDNAEVVYRRTGD